MTLVELLTVVVVVGILAAVAIPNYRKTVEREYYRKTEDLLLTIYSGERAYFFVNDSYVALNASSTNTQWRQIHMDDPNDISTMPVGFSVTSSGSGGSATFTATATRNGGPCDGRTRTINDSRTLGGNWGSCSQVGL